MHPDVKKTLNVFAIVIAAIILVMIISMVTIYRQSRDIEDTIQKKIDRGVSLPSVKIVKYDSLTQAKLDTIEARRSMSHHHVDNLYDGELQNVLDSMYNEVVR